jgi:hypothetical protein
MDKFQINILIVTIQVSFTLGPKDNFSRLALLLSLKMSKVDIVPIMAWSWLQKVSG